MYTIGEFSRITQLSVKALRFYHEQKLLVPEQISAESGYRLYGVGSQEKAYRIKALKEAGFTLAEIKDIFTECRREEDMERFLKKKREEARRKIREYREIEIRLKNWEEQMKSAAVKEDFFIKEMVNEDKLIASISIEGTYGQIGEGFQKICRKGGRWITGSGFALYHDMEYTEEGARFEACFDVKKEINLPGVECRRLAGGKVVSLLHRGPYGSQGASYAKLFDYCREKGYEPSPPFIEIYHKGPGMLFPGNPDKYLTEIQIPIKQ